ncbi:MAG: YggS family pyridoxal phosphate-dependent enzyme [Actinobacteria bacterium]|nr:YggS family pyridoxal phosphate-dependent enzyme [Actinomycetota bacterium]
MTAAEVAERLEAIRDRIARAGGRDVRVVGVTKTWGVDAVRAAAAAGCDAIGENYAQELVTKLTGEADLPPVHFIGRLQTNKVRLVAPFVDVYETVDRDGLAVEIAKRVPGARVLVQVSPDGDPDKGGCALGDVPALVERCGALGLVVVGLMTVGPTDGGPEVARVGFRAVRRAVDDLGLQVCSMGMSDDLEVAVGEGSTQVRIGSALFGPRRTTG